jgi:hypothetical protein
VVWWIGDGRLGVGEEVLFDLWVWVVSVSHLF